MPLSGTVRKFRWATQHVDSPQPKYTKSSQFKLSQIQKFPGKYEEMHFIRVVARCVNGTFARQWRVFHHQISCFPGAAPVIIKYYVTETSRKVSENEPLTTVLPCQKGTLRVSGRAKFPRGDSSYHTRPRPAYQELLRASARVERHIESSWRARAARHYRTCYAGTRELAQTGAPAGFFQKIYFIYIISPKSLIHNLSET